MVATILWHRILLLIASFLWLLLFCANDGMGQQQQQQQHPMDTNGWSSPIRNFRAHYDPGTDTITVDWEWRESEDKQLEDYDLFVRYKVSNQGDNEWRRVAADEDGLGARIPVERLLNNGDELNVQVQAEPRDPEEGKQAEQSEPLVIWIARRAERNNEAEEGADKGGQQQQQQQEEEEEGMQQNRRQTASANSGPPVSDPYQQQARSAGHHPRQQVSFSEDELIPPVNFTATVPGAGQVQLQWQQPPMPVIMAGGQPFYIMNVRQLSTNTGDRYPPQQIRVDGTEFVLNNLVPGEIYEFTMRTALSAEWISSAAAIVEIALPKDELMEVGNLIVTSRFRPDGHGLVNLTWEVPENLRGKIQSYEMRYADGERARQSGPELWEQLVFPGHSPTAQIVNMKADTEYLLRIRTTLTSGTQVESGEFRFRTPKLGALNPIARLDVIYSSESPTVRLQWILAPHVPTQSVAGYDVAITDRYDLPEQEWQHESMVGNAQQQLALDQLLPSTTYFVRIDVRTTAGQLLKSSAVYRFTTLDNLPLSSAQNRLEFNWGESLAFQQIGRGRVQISWTFPEAVRLAANGITIYYSSNAHQPMERWHRVALDSVDTRSVVLVGLRERVLYHVQIVPISMHDAHPMWEHAQRLQLKTEEDNDKEDGGGQNRAAENNNNHNVEEGRQQRRKRDRREWGIMNRQQREDASGWGWI